MPSGRQSRKTPTQAGRPLGVHPAFLSFSSISCLVSSFIGSGSELSDLSLSDESVANSSVPVTLNSFWRVLRFLSRWLCFLGDVLACGSVFGRLGVGLGTSSTGAVSVVKLKSRSMTVCLGGRRSFALVLPPLLLALRFGEGLGAIGSVSCCLSGWKKSVRACSFFPRVWLGCLLLGPFCLGLLCF